jgi:rubrerythrin
MKENIENQFNDILYKSLPLILFAFEKFRKPLIEKIGKLYEALDSNDSYLFNELYVNINKLINEREDVDSNKERLIESFADREKTNREILKEHSERLRNLERKINKISKDKKKNTEKNIIKPSVTIKEKDDTKIKIKRSKKNQSLKEKIICPNCNGYLTKAGKDYYKLTKLFCDNRGSRNGCRLYFSIDKTGNFHECEKCGNILSGSGKKKECLNCRNIQTITVK